MFDAAALKAKIPLNWALMANPINWVIVWVMVAIAGYGIALIQNSSMSNMKEQ